MRLFSQCRLTLLLGISSAALIALPGITPAIAQANTKTPAGQETPTAKLKDKKLSNKNKSILPPQVLSQMWLHEGRKKQRKRDCQGAIEDFTQAIKKLPQNIQAYRQRGLCYRQLLKFTQAIADFSQVIQLDPKDVSAYQQRARMYGVMYSDKALADYNQAITLAPRNAQLYIERGNLYQLIGQHPKAIDSYTQAIELDPENYKSHNRRGWSRMKLRDFKGAIVDQTAAIQRSPQTASLFVSRAEAHREFGQPQAAIDDYLQAAQLYKAEGRSVLEKQMRGYAQAIEDCRACFIKE